MCSRVIENHSFIETVKVKLEHLALIEYLHVLGHGFCIFKGRLRVTAIYQSALSYR